MSFFIRGKKQPSFKRKNGPIKVQSKVNVNRKKKTTHDEEIPSDSDNEIEPWKVPSDVEEEIEETAQEKRLRLTKEYLKEIELQEQEKADAADIDKAVIAHRLKEDVLEQTGKLRRTVADLYDQVSQEAILHMRCKDHRLSITCLVVSADNQCLYSASKDCTIVKWSLTEMKKTGTIKRVEKKSPEGTKGHQAVIHGLSVSSDGKFLASGDMDKIINIWDANTLHWIHTFKGHKAGITGLAFRKGTHTLYSASMDRSVKIWNLDEMAYVETLFGHQDALTSIDALTRERAITSGGRDNSIRLWKILEESQLVFNGHKGSIDCVRYVNEEHFVSCGDDGILSLWGSMKKKPLCSVNAAHGYNNTNNQPNWISCVAALPNTDLIATGSQDGYIRLWKCGEGFRALTSLFAIPVSGFVNALAFTSDGRQLICGIGNEHRLGRWWKIPSVRNEILVINLKQKSVS